MTDLLPIIFARGQNEGVDPRLAPPDVHAIARNVRWRKDGRPAKRYSLLSQPTTGLAASGFDAQPVNALTSWNSAPVIAVGSRVCQLSSIGWNAQRQADDGELSHFGPGVRDIIARDESSIINNATSGTAGSDIVMVLHVWDNGTNLYYCVKGVNGEVVVTPRFLFAGREARCISTDNFVYVVSKNGTTLDLRVFNPATLAITAGPSPGTLDNANSHFDACGRGADFLVSYQSAAGVVTTKLYTAVLVPVLTQTQASAVPATAAKIGVVGSAASNVFVSWQDPSLGQVAFQVFNNTMTGSLGGTLVETDANNNAQPGIVLESNTVAQIVWGGFVAATQSSYMRAAQVSAAGVLSAIRTFYGVSPASKPFVGPAFATLSAYVDGAYVWVSTCNSDAGGTKWDSQRAYYLVKFHVDIGAPLRRQLHVPNVLPSELAKGHLSDVLSFGLGYGFLTPLLNAVRFGNLLNPTYGVDTVSFRSIFESTKMAARDTAIAGRVLQFSGGSLFELNGAAEETGFSNFPVIQSVTMLGAGTGNLSAGTYIYKAEYEWLDNQGRRHRSAPSDPVTVTAVATDQAALVMKPLIADAHSLSAAGGAAGRGAVIHVYRTLVGQSTFHRVTPNTGAPQASVLGAATVTFNDIMADSVAAVQEFIYTDGGVADNTLCPPHTFHTVCNGRLWVGGQLDRCVITASKILVDGEPTQFSDLEAFSVFLPQACTGLASIDGTVVAFARDNIYFVSGDGPNDQGVGAFSPPTELPTDAGCIDWRSVLESSFGVFFQSRRGIYLLPRGFNTPTFIGLDVEDTLAAYPYIVSASLVVTQSFSTRLGEITARFVVGDVPDTPNATSVLVYDLRTGGWSVDELGTGPLLCGTWLSQNQGYGAIDAPFVESRKLAGSLALFTETPGVAAGSGFDGQFVSTTLGTGDIRPFGVAGYGGFDRVVLVGEFGGNCLVNVAVSVDGATPDTFVFPVTAADTPDRSVTLDVTPKTRIGASIRVTCSDAGNPGASEGFIMQALFIETETIGKTKRLAAGRKA